MRFVLLTAVFLGLLASLSVPGAFAQPTSLSYQGRLEVNNAPFNGTADFKFAIVNGATNAWSNDGTAVGTPTNSVALAVTDGLFSVLLGSSPMVSLSSSAVAGISDPQLRVWVNTGTGFEQLPDQPLGSSLYALHARSADESPGSFTANGVVHSLTGGFQFPDGTTQLTAAGDCLGLSLDIQATEGLANAGGTGSARILFTVNSTSGPVAFLTQADVAVATVIVPAGGCGPAIDAMYSIAISGTLGLYSISLAPTGTCVWKAGVYMLGISVDTPDGKVFGVIRFSVDL